jgi:hypothetical protein
VSTWTKTKARRRVLSPDDEWAADLRARIAADCHPWQRDAVEDPARRISLLVGRGGAKTTTMRARALIKLTSLHKQMIGYAATSADQARDLNWNKLKDVCEAYEIRTTTTNVVSKQPDIEFLDTKMMATCNRTGSIYRLRGVEDRRDAEKFRGFPQAEFQVDECGSFPPQLLEYLLNSCVAPRLGEALSLDGGRGGCLCIGSTPPAVLMGEFYEVTREGSARHRPYAKRNEPEYANWRGYSSHAWTLEDVIKLPEARDLYPALVANWETALEEKAEKGWGDDHPIWMREYLGQWSADNTATVYRYRPHKDGVEWNQWDPFGDRYLDGLAGLKVAIDKLPADVGAWHYAVAMDMGSRDPFACNVFAFAPADPERRIFHVGAFERKGMYGKLIAELLIGADLNADTPAGVIGAIGWPDGIVIDADQALIDELANVYGISVAKAERKMDQKMGSIELVNGDLIEGRIKIIKGSPLDRQIRVLQWKPDEYGNPREDKAQANHSTDTLVYVRRMIANLFSSGIVENEAPAKDYVDPMGLGSSTEEEGDFTGKRIDDDPYKSWSGNDDWG